jgi:hypothetical protein
VVLTRSPHQLNLTDETVFSDAHRSVDRPNKLKQSMSCLDTFRTSDSCTFFVNETSNIIYRPGCMSRERTIDDINGVFLFINRG